MRIDKQIVLTKDDIHKLTKLGQTLYIPKILLEDGGDEDDKPIPIVFDALKKRNKNDGGNRIPCPLGCGKMCDGEFGIKMHLQLTRAHKKDPASKKWITDYKERQKHD